MSFAIHISGTRAEVECGQGKPADPSYNGVEVKGHGHIDAEHQWSNLSLEVKPIELLLPVPPNEPPVPVRDSAPTA